MNEFGTGVGELGDAFDDFSIGKRKITGNSLDNYAKVLRDIRDWEFPWGVKVKKKLVMSLFSLSLFLSLSEFLRLVSRLVGEYPVHIHRRNSPAAAQVCPSGSYFY